MPTITLVFVHGWSVTNLNTYGELPLRIKTRYFIHDRFCMVIFRVSDSEGYAVTDYDLIFTAGASNNPNHLPQDFFADRQQNTLDASTVTWPGDNVVPFQTPA
jgi:hypothetical protein